ncbi:hypothetical protein AAG906_014331 [Vitis piasezkii]
MFLFCWSLKKYTQAFWFEVIMVVRWMNAWLVLVLQAGLVCQQEGTLLPPVRLVKARKVAKKEWASDAPRWSVQPNFYLNRSSKNAFAS